MGTWLPEWFFCRIATGLAGIFQGNHPAADRAAGSALGAAAKPALLILGLSFAHLEGGC